ncbi:MAG: PKD domain-containing protein, partial [Bacteroidetes bacterium]|nr:PKD domain-containing protein [Bacteroidota bacterium]
MYLLRPALALLLLACWAPVYAQEPAGAGRAVRIQAIHGPRVVTAGTPFNIRAQVEPGAGSPVTYLWDFGDGTLSEGALVAHVYRAASTYAVRLIARNAAGRDTLTHVVRVTPPAPSVSPAGSRPSPRTASSSAPFPGAQDASPDSNATRVPVVFRPPSLRGAEPINRTEGYTWVVQSDLWAARAQKTVLRYHLQGFRTALLADT